MFRCSSVRDGVHRVRPGWPAHRASPFRRTRIAGNGSASCFIAGSADVVGDDKDAAFFPEPVISPRGRRSLAFYHRPMLHLSSVDGRAAIPMIERMPFEDRESIRIGYVPLEPALADRQKLCNVAESVQVLSPDARWGSLKIGAGTPPVRIDCAALRCGSRSFTASTSIRIADVGPKLRYSAGIVIARSRAPRSRALSLAGTGDDAGVASRTVRRRGQRRISHGHRSAAGSRRARLRHLLRHGRCCNRRRAAYGQNVNAAVSRRLGGHRARRRHSRRGVGASRSHPHQNRFRLRARTAEAGRRNGARTRDGRAPERRRAVGALGPARLPDADLRIDRVTSIRPLAFAGGRGARAPAGESRLR